MTDAPRHPGEPVEADRLTPTPDGEDGPTQTDNGGDPDTDEVSQDPEARP